MARNPEGLEAAKATGSTRKYLVNRSQEPESDSRNPSYVLRLVRQIDRLKNVDSPRAGRLIRAVRRRAHWFNMRPPVLSFNLPRMILPTINREKYDDTIISRRNSINLVG